MKKYILIFVILTATCASLLGFGAWRVMQGEGFLVYHRSGQELEAARLLACMQHYRSYVEDLTGGYNPQVSIMIEDTGTQVNGFADTGNNKITLYTHFPADGTLSVLEDWWAAVGVHEYTHILQIGQDSGAPRVMRLLFGDSIRVNGLLPMWMIEGITVYAESNFSFYSGRLNGGEYPGIVASLAHHKALPSAVKGSYISDDTPLSNYYVLGGAFYQWLAKEYGQEKFAGFYQVNGSQMSSLLSPFLPAVGVDRAARRVYGQSFVELWDAWRAEMYKTFADLRMPAKLHSDGGYSKTHLSSHEDALYFSRRHRVKTGAGRGFSETQLIRYDPATDQSTVIHRQAGGFPAAYEIENDTLYYSRYSQKSGYPNTSEGGYGYQVELRSRALSGGASRLLTSGSIRAFCLLKDGRLLYAADQPDSRGSQIFSLDQAKKELLWQSDEYLIHRLHEHEGKIYVGARSSFRNSSIYILDSRGLIPIIDSPYQELLSGFWGDKLIFTANYEQQYHSFVFDPVSGEYARLAGAQYMNEALAHGDRLYYIAMLPQGQELASDQIDTVPFTLDAPKAPVPAYDLKVDYQKTRGYESGSALWPNLKHMMVPRRFRMPIYYEQSIGIALAGTDLLGYVPWWDMELVYDQEKEDFDFAAHLSSKLLQPLHQEFSFGTYEGGSLGIKNYLSLYRSNNFGLNQVQAGLALDIKDAYRRKIWTPHTSLAWSAPVRRGFTEIYARLESQKLISSDRNRLGYGGYHSLRQLLPLSTELNLKLHWAVDPDADPDEVFSPIFGYGDGIRANKGLVISGSLNHLLFRVREGLWNPQIYLEDVGGGIFFELAKALDAPAVDSQYSYGLELMGDFGMLFRMRSNVGLRLGLNRQGELKSAVLISLGY